MELSKELLGKCLFNGRALVLKLDCPGYVLEGFVSIPLYGAGEMELVEGLSWILE